MVHAFSEYDRGARVQVVPLELRYAGTDNSGNHMAVTRESVCGLRSCGSVYLYYQQYQQTDINKDYSTPIMSTAVHKGITRCEFLWKKFD